MVDNEEEVKTHPWQVCEHKNQLFSDSIHRALQLQHLGPLQMEHTFALPACIDHAEWSASIAGSALYRDSVFEAENACWALSAC